MREEEQIENKTGHISNSFAIWSTARCDSDKSGGARIGAFEEF